MVMSLLFAGTGLAPPAFRRDRIFGPKRIEATVTCEITTALERFRVATRALLSPLFRFKHLTHHRRKQFAAISPIA